MGYFGALTVICTVPFFIVQKRRPGQQLPAGTKVVVGRSSVSRELPSASDVPALLCD